MHKACALKCQVPLWPPLSEFQSLETSCSKFPRYPFLCFKGVILQSAAGVAQMPQGGLGLCPMRSYWPQSWHLIPGRWPGKQISAYQYVSSQDHLNFQDVLTHTAYIKGSLGICLGLRLHSRQTWGKRCTRIECSGARCKRVQGTRASNLVLK